MIRALLALVLAGAAAPLAAAADPVAVIDACVHRLDPALDVGYGRIAARCPELAPSLAGSAYAPWLPSNWNQADNNLSLGGLLELRTLLSRAPAPVLHAPQVARLAPLLARLRTQQEPPRNWWMRFKEWLRQILNSPSDSGGNGSLERFFGRLSLPQALLRLIVSGALLLLLLLAGSIVVNELRLAGVLHGRRTRGRAAPHSTPATQELSLEALARAGVRDRPRLLLELIVRQLMALRRLPPARALTVRELERAAQLPDADERARLGQLAAACEALRFGAQEPPPAALAAAAARGEELLTRLTAAASDAAGAR